MRKAYPNRVALIFTACVVAVVLSIPWPDAIGPSFGKSIWITVRDLNKTAVVTLLRFNAFQADLNTASSGEYVLPGVVQQALAIARGPRGRGIKRYELSSSFTADNWVLQQTVVALWPRTLEHDATARFTLKSDPIEAGCSIVDQQRDVALVYCP